jgi:hypothetical protein
MQASIGRFKSSLRYQGEAMPSHDFVDCFGGGWGWWDRGGCGFGDGGDFAEVVRGEDAGTDDGERLRCGGVKVVEAVDRSARDAERVAGADFDFVSFEREGDDAFDAVDGLLVGVVAVGDGDFGCGGDVELEDGDGATRVLLSTRKRIGNCPIGDFSSRIFAPPCTYAHSPAPNGALTSEAISVMCLLRVQV